MNRICGIYKITSPSGRIYIGQSVNIYGRLKAYRNKGYCNAKTLLAKSIKKYGWLRHTVDVVVECSKDKLNELEIYYIKFYNSFDSIKGLNLKAGGQSGGVCSEEVKQKLRKPKSNEAKEKYRIAATGRRCSEETKEKHRRRMIGNKYLLGSSFWLGRKHSEESKNKIRDKRKLQVMKKGNANWSEDARQKAKERMIGNKLCVGRKLSNQSIEKMKKSLSSKMSGQNNPMSKSNMLKRGVVYVATPGMKGKGHSEETKIKMKLSHKNILQKI